MSGGEPRPDVRWLQRRTNIADLLDDGIENHSDLRPGGGAPRAAPGDAEPSPRRPASPGRRPAPMPTARPPATSRLGVLIGLLLVASGGKLALFPVDMLVDHPRVRRPSFVEHVTPLRSRLYGSAGLALGLGVLGWATYRPRRRDAR